MATNPSITTIARNAACDIVVDMVDQGASPGELRIYGGARPASADAALAGNTLLVQFSMTDPAFSSAVNGQAIAGALPSASAIADGTATFFRVGSVNSGVFTPIWQGEAGTSGSDLNMNSVQLVTGGIVVISSLTYTQTGG